MPEERGFARAGQTAAAAIAALMAECFLVCAFFVSATALWILLALHAAIVSALALWRRYSPGMRDDVRIPLLLVSTTAALGPIGPAGTLLTMVLARRHLRKTKPFEEWYRALFPDTDEHQQGEFARAAAEADAENPASLAPFSEILVFGSADQKQALITLIDQSFRPSFGPILKRALMDENNSVRVQAATAMNKIEDRMHARTLELGRRLNENPGDVDALRTLARHYDQCLYSRILDSHREEETRGLALEAWRRYIDARPDDGETPIAISRLLLRGGQYEEAAAWLQKAIQDRGATAQAKVWYMESLYNLGRFAELRAFAGPRLSELDSSAMLPEAALEAARLWAETPRQ